MRYFFAQDDDCHWYMIPDDIRNDWNEWLDNGCDYDEYEEIWTDYSIGGGIEDITFENPINYD